MLPGLELEHRRPAGWVSRHVLGCLRLAGEEVDRTPLELETQLGGEEPHLVTVGGGGEVVEPEHGTPVHLRALMREVVQQVGPRRIAVGRPAAATTTAAFGPQRSAKT